MSDYNQTKDKLVVNWKNNKTDLDGNATLIPSNISQAASNTTQLIPLNRSVNEAYSDVKVRLALGYAFKGPDN